MIENASKTRVEKAPVLYFVELQSVVKILLEANYFFVGNSIVSKCKILLFLPKHKVGKLY